MSDKKAMSKLELLNLLEQESNKNAALSEKISSLEAQIADRRIDLESTGSIAEASLKLNNVFADAQAAAEQYLYNIRNHESVCQNLIEEAEAKAAQIVADAEAQASDILVNAEAKAAQMTAAAEENAARTVSDAEAKAAQTTSDAKAETDAYWDEVRAKLDAFYSEHEEIKKLLNADFLN